MYIMKGDSCDGNSWSLSDADSEWEDELRMHGLIHGLREREREGEFQVRIIAIVC